MEYLPEIVVVFICLGLGGVLKGATGAGAPVLAVPAIAMLFDVQFAVVVMLMPNLLTNGWQAWRFRHQRLPAAFLWSFAGAGTAGVFVGTLVLVSVPQSALSLVVALAVLAYILLRVARPGWAISYAVAQRLSIPAGIVAGALQGASGMSAPASLTFLNAMSLERPLFISTVSVFFATMTLLQIPTLGYLGVLTPAGLLISLAAVVPILAFMPAGAALARRFSKATFDRAILALLAILALKLAVDAVLGG